MSRADDYLCALTIGLVVAFVLYWINKSMGD